MSYTLGYRQRSQPPLLVCGPIQRLILLKLSAFDECHPYPNDNKHNNTHITRFSLCLICNIDQHYHYANILTTAQIRDCFTQCKPLTETELSSIIQVSNPKGGHTLLLPIPEQLLLQVFVFSSLIRSECRVVIGHKPCVDAKPSTSPIYSLLIFHHRNLDNPRKVKN